MLCSLFPPGAVAQFVSRVVLEETFVDYINVEFVCLYGGGKPKAMPAMQNESRHLYQFRFIFQFI